MRFGLFSLWKWSEITKTSATSCNKRQISSQSSLLQRLLVYHLSVWCLKTMNVLKNVHIFCIVRFKQSSF